MLWIERTIFDGIGGGSQAAAAHVRTGRVHQREVGVERAGAAAGAGAS